ncbi:MAG: transcription factor FapR [Brevinematales bacterium]|jgi:acyl-coenzyme A thioesterase PaaI-like protein
MTDRFNPVEERHIRIHEEMDRNPFILDEELANILKVSIHTIRSDRRKIGIPEVRRRGKEVSDTMFAQARTLKDPEITGDILELDLDREGLSLLDTDESMVVKKSSIIRGHILFAQANSLAIAILDTEVAMTAEASIKFISPVRAGERVLAKARVISSVKHKREVEVIMKTKKNLVFEGRFTIYCINAGMAAHLSLLNEDEISGGNK